MENWRSKIFQIKMGITANELKFGVFLIISVVTGGLLTEPIKLFLKNAFPNVPPFALGIVLFLALAFFFNIDKGMK